MKRIILLLTLSISLSSFALPIKGGFSFSNYDQASNSDTQLKFTVVSTKVGLFSSEVDGYVKSFTYKAEFDDQNLIVRDMEISFDPKMMDTDGESRDEKLHALCMEADKYPTLEIAIKGPAFLKDVKENEYPAVVKIRGKEKSASVKMKASYDEDTKQIVVVGSSIWSLKEMEIPDPSIAVATLSDEIVIHFQLILKPNSNE